MDGYFFLSFFSLPNKHFQLIRAYVLCIGPTNSGSVGSFSRASVSCWLLHFRQFQLLQRRLDRLLYVSPIVKIHVGLVFGFES